MELTLGTCLAQSWCCPAEQDGSIWGGWRKVREETQTVFLFGARGRQLKELEGKNGEEGRGGYPHTSQELSLLTARLWGCAKSRRYTNLQSQQV